MKIRAIISVGVIVAVVGIAGCIVTDLMDYAHNPSLSPAYGIKLQKGLHGEARIIRDKWGVAHVTADDESDMFFAIGYAQAQDRLFQMDLYRRLIEGRLAEIIGDMKFHADLSGVTSTLVQDKIHRIIGYKYIGEAGEALLREKQPDVYLKMQRYCDGVNAFIADAGDNLPLEFNLLKYKPEPWRPADVVSLGRFVGWSLSSNLDVESLRWALVQKLGEKQGWQALPLYRKPVPEIPTIIPRELVDYRKITPNPVGVAQTPPLPITASVASLTKLTNVVSAIRAYDNLVPMGHASNNWVVAPKLTASGKPILANDPHLGHMMPSTFWTVHLSGAGYDVYGVTFPGMPFIVLGHNRHLAWGCTTSRADVQDVYVEKFDEKGEKYLYKGNWEPIVKRKEFLKCRKGIRGPLRDAGSIEVRLTRHGPIINDLSPDLLEDTPPMALRWTGYDFSDNQDLSRALMASTTVEEFMDAARKIPSQTISNEAEVILALMKGNSVEAFKNAMARQGLPDQNWVAVDDQGHIGYMAGGRIPVRAIGNGALPVEGWSGEYEWIGFIPPEHIPQVFDPERGYIATANNEVVPPNDYPYVFSYSYVGGWRAQRIEEMLKAKPKLTVQDMAEIQNDVKMMAAVYMAPPLLKALDDMKDITPIEKQAKEALAKWDYFATTDSVGCAIFNEWRRQITSLILKDELGAELFNSYEREDLTSYEVDAMIIQGSSFFDDVTTKDVETREDIFRAAFRNTVAALSKRLGADVSKWEWGKLHTITWAHPLGIGPLAKYLNYGPLPHPGSRGTVRNAWYVGPGTSYATTGGACLRHIIDMADVDNSMFVIDGGESGQWKSAHYSDGAGMWYRSEYMKAIMNIGEALKDNQGLLILRRAP